MTITSITLWHVPVSATQIQVSQNQRQASTVEATSVVVALQNRDGVTGWGEICPMQSAGPVFVDAIAPAIAEMSDVILGAEPTGPAAFGGVLDRHLPGNAEAKSALDMALWDLLGKSGDLPLHALLGGREQVGLPAVQELPCLPPDQLVEVARIAISSGTEIFRVHLGVEGDWRRDADRLIALRETVAPRATVIGDWRGRADRVSAIRTARETSGLDLILEQPCGTLAECAAVRLASGQVLKLDESLRGPQDVLDAHAAECLDAATIKLSTVGGVTRAMRMRDMCLAMGVPVSIEDIAGSDIAAAAALHLAAATPKAMLLHTSDMAGGLTPRLDRDAPVRRFGQIAVPQGAGLGIAPDMEVLGAPLAVIE